MNRHTRLAPSGAAQVDAASRLVRYTFSTEEADATTTPLTHGEPTTSCETPCSCGRTMTRSHRSVG